MSKVAGSGSDSLVLRISQDYYAADAQYTVSVDGVQIGGTFTASALRSSGQSDTLTLKGNWAAGSHKVSVKFLNDAWGGTAATDRNLYLDGATYNGQVVPNATASLWSAGAAVFSYTEAAPATPVPVSLSAGSGSDILVLKVSQDAFQGSAQYTVKVDGVQIGGIFTASALHSSGQSDTLTLKGNWAAGTHAVTVTFTNDYAVSGQGDRNLFVEGATYNGTSVSGAAAEFWTGGSKNFAITDTATTQPPSPEPPPPSGGGTAPAGAIILKPGASIQSAVNAAPDGATFWLEAGEYRMQSVTPKSGQTFLGADGAVLNGSRLLTGFTQDGDDWMIGGQTQEGPRSGAPALSGRDRAGYPDAVFLDGKPLQPVDTRAEVVPGKFYFDYAADRIYIGDNPAGHKVEAAVTQLAFGGAAQNVTLENLVVEKYASPVQHGAVGGRGGVRNWTIDDVDFRLNYGLGVKLGDGSDLLNSRVVQNGQMGAGGSGTGIVVDRTEFARNSEWSGIDPRWEGGGFKFAFTDGLIVRNSYSHDNYGNGMWTDINNVNTLYEGNRIENNAMGGIHHELSYEAVIRNNTIVGNGAQRDTWLLGAGIQIENSQGVEAYGNTVDNRGGGAGISLIYQDRTSDQAAFNAPRPYNTINNNIHDNHVYGPAENGAVANYNASVLWNGNNRFDGNDYHLPDPSARVFAYNGGMHSFDQLRAVSPWEDNGSAVLL
ncbi:carbohydrate-binding domain-containing protein [Craurococcus roseus]|uniref:carbohydrate-binding domain-containing protein n=1 Tax=Craurococcus roseus TaxID=77585 RepID=UPI0031D99907